MYGNWKVWYHIQNTSLVAPALTYLAKFQYFDSSGIQWLPIWSFSYSSDHLGRWLCNLLFKPEQLKSRIAALWFWTEWKWEMKYFSFLCELFSKWLSERRNDWVYGVTGLVLTDMDSLACSARALRSAHSLAQCLAGFLSSSLSTWQRHEGDGGRWSRRQYERETRHS